MKLQMGKDFQKKMNKGFDIIICTWNNFDYLKLLIRSIRENSSLPHTIIVHVNESNSSILSWLDKEKITYTHNSKNIGLCKGTNLAVKKANKDWLCFFDDDMYALPGWDINLVNYHQDNNLDTYVWLGSFMIEPGGTSLNSVISKNYGKNINEFKESSLLSDYKSFSQNLKNISCNSTCPLLLNRELFLSLKGYDEDFDPGIGAELGLVKRFWDAGVRKYIAVKDSLVYHFGSRSTSRVRDGQEGVKRDKLFKHKYGITREDFINKELKKGNKIQL